MPERRPNVLFVMTDQQRFDTIASLGCRVIRTPNLDRLVARGLTFTRAHSTTPVCIPARYTIMSGCDAPSTGVWMNMRYDDMHRQIVRRCGTYLPAAMRAAGYRTWGVGKFHTNPWDGDLGFDVQLHSEELYGSAEQRAGDAYARFLATEHPQHDWIEALMGERTEMYYVPQMSPLPAALTVESWATDRAIEQVRADDGRPWFGFVSYIGPHPPFAPPLPWNRMYDPDLMSDPVRGDREVDHLDETIPWMNHAVWADDISDGTARVLKARYYGEITYIDDCIGRLLDALEERGEADDTLICFFADHCDHLGDHTAWQKESFFEGSTRVPFLVSWPGRLPAGERRDALVGLADLFGLATSAAGALDVREGVDLLGVEGGTAAQRDVLFGWYGVPGTKHCKVMVRQGRWKYIHMANGGREQLFDLEADPHEVHQLVGKEDDVAAGLHALAVAEARRRGLTDALDGDRLAALPFAPSRRTRIRQFDWSRGVADFTISAAGRP